MRAREHTGLTWRKSSFSGTNGGCVEVAWRTSSYSGGNGDCVEVALHPATVAVRDSKDPAGGHLHAPADAWRAFLTALN
ncbi:DUF397 domain-containing protein [Haloechinothrix sp. YIM 98757]|uniref:DUF397 domain-containing protein n=1 Tax=Haloechinothrix aidingensis TaxID=2752311 RepID=A0A838AEI5_9PSEU|nr:DUF397 domain-containing protein [Haloechinothrix aidingensis]MBA0127719.1 DUF397 domain-containing protein [Haloechinothrix aidingensis]